MIEKNSIDKELLKENSIRYWGEMETRGIRTGIKLCDDTREFNIKQSELFTSIVEGCAVYSTYMDFLDKNVVGYKDEVTQDFCHLMSQYALAVEVSKYIEKKFPEDIERRENFKINSFDVLARQTEESDLDSDLAPMMAHFENYFLKAIRYNTTARKNKAKGLDVYLIYQYMSNYKEALTHELEKHKYQSMLEKVSGNPVELNKVTLDGLVYVNGDAKREDIEQFRYSEIIGNNKSKIELKNLGLKLLQYSSEYKMNPNVMAKTVLLLGEPGGGKTSLIKAFYNYLVDNSRNPKDPSQTKDIQYFEISPTMISKWAGEAENRLKNIFMKVNDPTKISVVSAEDIDMLLHNRDRSTGGNNVLSTLSSTLMNLLQGVTTNYLGNYIVISSTNKDHHLEQAHRDRLAAKELYVEGPITPGEYSDLVSLHAKKALGDNFEDVFKVDDADIRTLGGLLSMENSNLESRVNGVDVDDIKEYKFAAREVENIIRDLTGNKMKLIDDDDKRDILSDEEISSCFNSPDKIKSRNSELYEDLTFDDMIHAAKYHILTKKVREKADKESRTNELFEKMLETRQLELMVDATLMQGDEDE